jgi:hypothetical protein
MRMFDLRKLFLLDINHYVSVVKVFLQPNYFFTVSFLASMCPFNSSKRAGCCRIKSMSSMVKEARSLSTLTAAAIFNAAPHL